METGVPKQCSHGVLMKVGEDCVECEMVWLSTVSLPQASRLVERALEFSRASSPLLSTDAAFRLSGHLLSAQTGITEAMVVLRDPNVYRDPFESAKRAAEHLQTVSADPKEREDLTLLMPILARMHMRSEMRKARTASANSNSEDRS